MIVSVTLSISGFFVPTTTEVYVQEPQPQVLTLEQKIGNEVLLDIAYCESTLRQFNSKGEVLRGVQNDQDVGLFQINEHYHLKRSIELGIDIYTEDGNIEFAKLLYKEQGARPWKWSAPCHGHY